ncbi:MAG: hypothetical protein ACWGQW_01160 [bacterium]
MATDYTTVDDVKVLILADTRLGVEVEPTLGRLITVYSRAVDSHLNRRPGAFAVSTDSTQYFNGSGGLSQYIGEIAALPTTVAVAETGQVDNAEGSGGSYTTWTASDYYPWPMNALADGMPYSYLEIDRMNGSKSIWFRWPRSVKVTAKFGFSTSVPDEIRMATEIMVVRAFKRASQAYADAGAVTELARLTYVKKMDPDVVNMLELDKFATPGSVL